MKTMQTIGAAEFKAKCLDILDRLGSRSLERVVVTKRGKPVAVLTPPPAEDADLPFHGFMRGSIIIPADIDLTEPIADEHFIAAFGKMHD